MFNLGKKPEKDPKKALEDADKTLNKGLMGVLTKGFMGKDFVNDMNAGIAKGQEALAGVEQQQMLVQNGLEGTAEVLGIEDTGNSDQFQPCSEIEIESDPSLRC